MTTPSEFFALAVDEQRAGRLQQAAGLYRQVVQADPRHAWAWHQLGVLLFQANEFDAAYACLARAIRLDGAQVSFHHNMAACCRALDKLADAQASYEQALRLDADFALSRIHLCFVLYARGQMAAADRLANEALARAPSSAEEHAILGTLALLRGDYATGWAENEFRLEPWSEPRAVRAKKWDGSELDGRTILLYSEQGLGDALQMVRYVPHVIARGGRPILAVPDALIPLLNEAGLCPLVPRNSDWPPHDAHCSLSSLPWALATTLDTIPCEVPYLKANDELVRMWQQRLSHLRVFRVGVHWQGNKDYRFDRTRSIELAHFAALASVPGVQLISLQKNPFGQPVDTPGQFELVDFGRELDAGAAFMDTAALMQHLDLVVTCDSAIAHLAGALGVHVWVAIHAMGDFRWLLARDDSPWYPTMRLFRQRESGGWPDVFERIAAALADRVDHANLAQRQR